MTMRQERIRYFMRTVALAALLVTWASVAGAGGSGSDRPMTLSFGVDLSSWSIDLPGIDRYTQTVMPVAYSIPLGQRLTVDLGAHPFRTSFSRTGGRSDIVSHLGDTQVRAAYRLGRDLGMAVVSVGLPTGTGKLEADQFNNAALAADRRLDNPVTSFGTGLVVNGSLAMAKAFGNWVLGVGTGYSYRAEYAFTDSLAEYDPGDEINLTLGIDRNFRLGGKAAQITVDAIYTLYTDDKSSGASIFEVGEKLFVEGRALFAVGPIDPLIIDVRHRSRADSQDPTTANSPAIETGNELDADLTARLPLGESVALDLNTMLRRFEETSAGAGGANILGFGCGLRARLRPGLILQPAALFQFGDIDDVDVTGIRFQVGMTTRL